MYFHHALTFTFLTNNDCFNGFTCHALLELSQVRKNKFICARANISNCMLNLKYKEVCVQVD